MAPCRGNSGHHSAPSRRGATAAAQPPLLLSLGVLVLALTPDPAASFAGGPNLPAARRQRYRGPTASSSGRRRGTLVSAADPSTPSPPPKRPAAAAKKKGVGNVKFGGRVSRSVEDGGLDPKGGGGDEEEDVRKSARWGVKPPSPPEIKIPKVLDVGGFKNPLDGVGKSLRKVRNPLWRDMNSCNRQRASEYLADNVSVAVRELLLLLLYHDCDSLHAVLGSARSLSCS